MAKIALLLFFQICLIIVSTVSAYECLNNNNQFYCKFSTRTPYRFIANYNESQLNYPGCLEKRIWLMIRHGTRFPGKKHIRSMVKNLPELQKKIIENFKSKNSQLSADSIEDFTKWKLYFDSTYAMNLAEEGEHELTDLAERMQARFPTVFRDNYDGELYKFKFTATQRTEQSAKSFVLGLFGQQHSENITFPEPEHKDPVLRFYKKCERWRQQIDKNPETYKEKELFIKTDLFQKLLSECSKRVGFKLDYDDLKLIYMICAFETAWKKIVKSPWCDVLTLDAIQALEFIEDLEYYWVDGYGHSLNYDQACPALRDMFEFFQSSAKPLVTTYFTHSGSILKMLSILGIAKDEQPLTHKSYLIHKDRKWKVSLIDAFASNLAFIYYDCEKGGPSILVLHQERPVYISGCPDNAPCPLSIMKDKFPDTEQECQFDTMCSL